MQKSARGAACSQIRAVLRALIPVVLYTILVKVDAGVLFPVSLPFVYWHGHGWTVWRRGTIEYDNVPETSWLQEVGRRIRAQFWLKSLGIPGFIALFFVAYFLLLHFPLFQVTIVPKTALDRWIGFHPWAIVFYFSLWMYVSLPPSLCLDLRSLLHYLYAAIGLSLAAMLVYLFWPTATPAFNIDWSQYPGFGFLKSADLARNAFPSLHAAFSVLSGLWLARFLRRIHAPKTLQVVNGLWCLGILYSTMATRQHVALDVYSGILFGLATFVVYWWFALRHADRLRSGSIRSASAP